MKFLQHLSDNDWGRQIRRIAHGWLFDDVPPAAFPESVILPLENPDLHEEDRFLSPLADVTRYRAMAVGSHQGRRIGVLKSKFGGPAVAMTVELLAAAGVRVVVGVGYCGGLRGEVACGDLVLPLAAVRNDGVTAHYVAPAYPAVADLESLDHLRRLARRAGHAWHCGVVWSTDAVLMETTSLVNEWSGHGVLAVDMETSALYTIARLWNLRASAVLVASDNPAACRQTDTNLLVAGTSSATLLALDFAATVDFLQSENSPPVPQQPAAGA